MKKLIYIALLAFLSSLTFTSCTEEEVSPRTEVNNGGANTSNDGKN